MSTSPIYATPEAVEQAFYRTIESKDIALMADLWSRSAQSECIHPMSERVQGHAAILHSWAEIFAHRTSMRFEVVATRRTQIGDLAVHVLHEAIRLENEAAHSRMIATNVYVREEDGWKLLVHHASPVRRAPARRGPVH